MISFVCYLWHQSGYRWTYTAAHVNRWAAMVDDHYQGPHRIICISDRADGFGSGIEVMTLGQDRAALESPHGPGAPSCYRRLSVWARDAGEALGKRIVLMDIDCTIVASLAPLVDRPEPIVMTQDPLFPEQYNGGMLMLDAGARPDVLEDFDGEPSIRAARAAGYRGSDQAWLSYKLGKQPAWTHHDGVVSYRKHGFNKSARVVMFHGSPKPWEI